MKDLKLDRRQLLETALLGTMGAAVVPELAQAALTYHFAATSTDPGRVRMTTSPPAANAPSEVTLRGPAPILGDVTIGHVIDDTFPSLEVRMPNGARLVPEVRYSTILGYRPMTLDMYLPPQHTERPASGFPMIMFIHGGSWARGDSRASRPLINFPQLLAEIAARGYVVTSINYRMVGEGIWPMCGQDIKAGLRFLRLNAAKFGIDPQRFATWGASCGGHLSGIAATTADSEALKPADAALAAVSDRVQAAVSWYGGFNMASITEQCNQTCAFSRNDARAPEWKLLGGPPQQCGPEMVRSASPVSFVSADTAPMLLVVGDKDDLIPSLQSYEMAERMQRAGAYCELLVLPGVGHDFAGASKEVTLMSNQKALNATVSFLDRMLYGAR